MARSRSRERNRRKYSSSDDSDYERKRRGDRKKKRASRSRSRSTDSERKRYKDRESSSRYRSGYDDRPGRSSSRSERKDSKQRQNTRRDRSRSRSPSYRSRREKDSRKGGRNDSRDAKEDTSSTRTKEEGKQLSFKERVAKLASTSSDISANNAASELGNYKIDTAKVAEIDAQGFHQETFVSNANKKEAPNLNGKAPSADLPSGETSSHENAIFGASSQTVSNAIASTLTANGSNKHEFDDEILGPSLLIDQSTRTKRWLEKLQLIRKRILQESA